MYTVHVTINDSKSSDVMLLIIESNNRHDACTRKCKLLLFIEHKVCLFLERYVINSKCLAVDQWMTCLSSSSWERLPRPFQAFPVATDTPEVGGADSE